MNGFAEFSELVTDEQDVLLLQTDELADGFAGAALLSGDERKPCAVEGLPILVDVVCRSNRVADINRRTFDDGQQRDDGTPDPLTGFP